MKENNEFDKGANQWAGFREFPWNRLRYELTHDNIVSVISKNISSVLNVGCGDGIESYLFDSPHISHTLTDISSEMIEKAKILRKEMDVSGDFEYIQADVSDLSALSGRKYDLILLHNVLEYTDPTEAIENTSALLASDGLLSLRHLNKFSNPYIAAFNNDIDTALEQIDSGSMTSSFGMEIMTYSAEEIRFILSKLGIDIVCFHGIMSLCNYFIKNELKYDANVYDKLKTLEKKLSKAHPHYLLSRFGHFLCRKTQVT